MDWDWRLAAIVAAYMTVATLLVVGLACIIGWIVLGLPF